MSGRPIIIGRDEGDTAWMRRGRCYGIDPATMFPNDTAELNVAKAVCAGCCVIDSCLAYALRNNEKHGCWAGLGERERSRLRRRLVREGKLPRRSGQAVTPIRHGEANQYMRCLRANGAACVACKAAWALHRAEQKQAAS